MSCEFDESKTVQSCDGTTPANLGHVLTAPSGDLGHVLKGGSTPDLPAGTVPDVVVYSSPTTADNTEIAKHAINPVNLGHKIESK